MTPSTGECDAAGPAPGSRRGGRTGRACGLRDPPGRRGRGRYRRSGEPAAGWGGVQQRTCRTAQPVVVRRRAGGRPEAAAEAGKDAVTLVAEAAEDLPPGTVLVVVHSGGGRAKALATRLKELGAQTHPCAKITKAADRADFVRREFRSHKATVDEDTVSLLLDAVGSDARELAAACSQLVADTGGTVDAAAVRRYHTGRAEVTGFDVADKAVQGTCPDRRRPCVGRWPGAYRMCCWPMRWQRRCTPSRGLVRSPVIPTVWPANSACLHGGYRRLRNSPAAGHGIRWERPCGWWPPLTPTSKARQRTPTTSWKGGAIGRRVGGRSLSQSLFRD